MTQKNVLALIAGMMVMAAIVPAAIGVEVKDMDGARQIIQQSNLPKDIRAQIETMTALNISSETRFTLIQDMAAVVTTGNMTGTIVILDSVNEEEGTVSATIIQGFNVNTEDDLHVGDTVELEGGTLAVLDIAGDTATFVIGTQYTPMISLNIMPHEQTTNVGHTAMYGISLMDLRNICLSGDCGPKSYDIVVRGLPDTTEYETTVELDVNETHKFNLSVFVNDTQLADTSMQFGVEAQGEHSSARDEATLNVGPLSPPPAPTEQVNLDLQKGWNLVSLPGKLVRFLGDPQGNLVAYVYLTEQERYVSLREARIILGDGLAEYLAHVSFWVYSENNRNLPTIVEPLGTSEVDLREGWNFAPIREEWTPYQFGQLDTNCTFSRTYGWDEGDQQWLWIGDTYRFNEGEANEGFVAKTTGACSIDVPNLLVPPPLPGG